jgi:tetratricopeptide (TPR) repeat protein
MPQFIHPLEKLIQEYGQDRTRADIARKMAEIASSLERGKTIDNCTEIDNKKAKYYESSLSKYIAGSSKPEIEMLLLMCIAIGCSLDELIEIFYKEYYALGLHGSFQSRVSMWKKQVEESFNDLFNPYLTRVYSITNSLEEKSDEVEQQEESLLSRLRRQTDNLLSERLRLSFEQGQTTSPQLQRQLRVLLAEFENLPENIELTGSDRIKKGDLLFFANKYSLAITWYKKAIDQNPSDDSAYYGIGNSLKKLEKYEEAEAAYNKAIKINPRNFLAWTNLGMAVAKLKRYPEAVNCVDQAIQIKPDYYRPWYNKACYLARLQKLDETIIALRKAISLEASLCKGLAKLDADFNSIRGDERFLELLDG